MKIPPDYRITPEIIELVAKIEANRFYLSSLEILPQAKERIKRKSILKSAIFSARIEGNPLTLESISRSPHNQQKIEINNISRAVDYIEKKFSPKKKISKKEIFDLHAIVMKGLPSERGSFRTGAEALFNQAGATIFLAPPASEVSALMEELIKYINSDREKLVLIKAMLAHLVFERIHPFVDGNGRVGRLLITMILAAGNCDFGLFVPFEQYVEDHREQYYYYLSIGDKEPEEYLAFMLKAFYGQTEKLKQEVVNQPKDSLLLPPRREEIYRIIQDHKMASFDAIRRRFLRVPERTLRYDLRKLLDQGLIVRIGITNGSYYTVKEEKEEYVS